MMLTINNMGNVNQNTVYRKLSKEISLTFLKSINIQKLVNTCWFSTADTYMLYIS